MEKPGIVYECIRYGAKVPSEELELRGGEIKCIICGYRILKKVKPPVVKRVQSK
jgi:DNA-directed RNA polymerase subunit RPC12/RpoP